MKRKRNVDLRQRDGVIERRNTEAEGFNYEQSEDKQLRRMWRREGGGGIRKKNALKKILEEKNAAPGTISGFWFL